MYHVYNVYTLYDLCLDTLDIVARARGAVRYMCESDDTVSQSGRAHSRHTLLRRLKPRWPAPYLAVMGPTARLRRTAAHICGASAPARSSASAVAGRRRRSCDAVAPMRAAAHSRQHAAVEGEAPAVASSEAGLTQEEIDAVRARHGESPASLPPATPRTTA